MEYFGKSMTDEEVDEMFAKVDSDQSGQIGYSEFLVATMSSVNLVDKKKMSACFRIFDLDDEGVLTIDKVGPILSEVDPNINVVDLFNQIDSNGDGYINYEEFIEMIKTLV